MKKLFLLLVLSGCATPICREGDKTVQCPKPERPRGADRLGL